MRRAVLVAKKRRARLVPPGVRRPDRSTPCEVAEWSLWSLFVGRSWIPRDWRFLYSVGVVLSTEDRSLRWSQLCLARWRSSLLKNGMVTLWAAIYLRISLRRCVWCGPPDLGIGFEVLHYTLAASSDVAGASSLSMVPRLLAPMYVGSLRSRLELVESVCDALAPLNEGVHSSGRLFW